MVMEVPKQLLDRYDLGEIVGVGGMGTVVRAHDNVLGRQVAIKLLKPELSAEPGMVERFKREARIAAALSHPGIAQVYDFAQEGNQSFIVMEFLQGEDLHTIVTREGIMDPRAAARIVAGAADALDHAHERGAVHRDMKPANIFLTQHGEVKITDFGVARLADQARVTTTGAVVGTSYYLSPEQASGQETAAPGDIYSLGCVLFELLTGEPPFQAESPVAVAMAHISQPPPSPTDLNPDIPEALAAVVERALAKDPRERFASAGEMGAALREAAQLTPPEPKALSSGSGDAAPTKIMAPAPRTEVLEPETPTEPEIRPTPAPLRRRRAATRGAILAVAALAALVVFFVALAGLIGGSGELPDWVGRHVDEASAEAERLGLEVEVVVEPSTRPAGEVLSQEPAPGTGLDDIDSVRVAISTGPVTVPGVVGSKREDALETLQAAGLQAIAQGDDDNDAVVTGQDPPEGQMVAPGSAVTLTAEKKDDDEGGPPRRGRGKGDD